MKMSESQVLHRRVVCEIHHIYPVYNPVDNFCRNFWRAK